MSILINPDAFPQAIRAVYDLAKFMPGTAEEFSRLLVPHGHFSEGGPVSEDGRYRDGRDILKSAIGQAKTFGLIHDVGEILSAVTQFADDRTYLNALSQSILRQEDRFRAAAQWFLLQDAYKAPSEKTFDDYQKNSQAITQFVSNGTQFSNFQRWMRYLGFARDVGGAFMPDPTRAIQNAWPELAEIGEYSMGDFYARLREVLPSFPEIENSRIPGSISFALKSMASKKRCTLESYADSDKWTLTLPHGGLDNISHIRVLKVNA